VSREVLILTVQLMVMTLLVVVSMPILWNLASTPILPIRMVDQALKTLVFLGILYIYVKIFDKMYKWSYKMLARCGRE